MDARSTNQNFSRRIFVKKVAALSAGLYIASSERMAKADFYFTEYLYPTQAGEFNDDGKPWINHINVTGTGGGDAEGSGTLGRYGDTNRIWGHAFGFQIPSNATVRGVWSLYSPAGQNGDVRESWINLTRPGTGGLEHGPNLTPSYPANAIWPNTPYGTIFGGGDASLWGFATLTPAQVNHTDFGLAIAGERFVNNGGQRWFKMDDLRLKIVYEI
jgi:hypothetical protein